MKELMKTMLLKNSIQMDQLIKNQTQKFIKLLPFSDMDLWDVKRYYSERIKSKFPIVKLGQHIKEESHRTKLSDKPKNEFGILGVSNKNGVFDAYKIMGNEINQPYKKMDVGWIAYNPYRINVGSIGLRTPKNEFNFISPAYVVFSCKSTLLPDFVFKLFKTDRFNRIIKENTTGSVRQNLTFDILKLMDFPLPPLEEQNRLLNVYNSKSEKAKKQEYLAKLKEREIDDYLLKKLNVSLSPVIKTTGWNFVEFSEIDRWAADYLLNLKSISGIYQSHYPIMKIKNILLSYQYGLSEKATEKPIGTPMLRMNNIYDSELVIDDLKYTVIPEDQREKVLLNKNDLLFNRTNSKELVGKTAVFELKEDFCFASYLIRLKFDLKRVNIHYINYLFNSPIGRMQIDMVSRQVLGQANINAQELQEFIFPIPDLNTQNNIVKEIFAIREQVLKLRNKAEANQKEALNEFEKDIFLN